MQKRMLVRYKPYAAVMCNVSDRIQKLVCYRRNVGNIHEVSTILFCFGSTTRRIMCSVVVFFAGQELVIDNYCISVHGQIWQSFQQGIVCNVCVHWLICVLWNLAWCFFVKQLSLLLFIDVSWPCIWRQFQCNTDVYFFLAWTVLLHFPISDSDFCRSDSALAVDCACVISASTLLCFCSHIIRRSVIKIIDSCLYNLSLVPSANCIICDWWQQEGHLSSIAPLIQKSCSLQVGNFKPACRLVYDSIWCLVISVC